MPPLYFREAQVIELTSLGLTSKEIAAALGITVRTVNWHRRQALARQKAAMAARRVPTRRPSATSAATPAE